MDNLPELRDIHLPNGVSFFPPAYGWGVILFGIICLIIFYELWRIAQQKSKKRYALKVLSQLDQKNIIASAVTISELLRRICVYKFPQASSLYGKDWIAFLNQKTEQTATANTAELLMNAPYLNQETSAFSKHDLEDLILFSKDWIGENL
ncbi:MAG: DUF4381 domain-containing protein [Alphaproteobacteria bacterium]|nr:DUF4381 domain-containing protein [Alphaproteobacteria bacterium]